MPTTTSPPILIWQPGGGTPTWTPALPPAGHAAPENGLTALTLGQNYVDVVFVTTQPRADWTFAGLEVVNVTDTAPLNIWVGVATSKTRHGFRVYLNGLPDTGNYYLDWTINGGTVADAGTATTYTLSGPDNGPNGTGTTFTVALPLGTTVGAPVTVTPDDGGVPGTFSPATVELTTDMPSANFVYTPGSYGARTITVTNDSLLADPGGIAFTSVVGTYLLSGPTTGVSGVPSTNFTVALPVGGVTLNTIIVTPTDALPTLSAGTFTPSTVNLTTGAPSATFTYTPVSGGPKTISTTNNRGLTDPGSLSYTVSVPPPFDPTTIAGLKLWLKADAIPGPPADGTSIGSWGDSSGGTPYALTNTGGAAAPKFKTGIVNALPVIRFDGVANYLSNNTLPALSQPSTIFTVGKQATSGTNVRWVQSAVGAVPQIVYLDTSGFFSIYAGSAVVQDAVNRAGAFHVFTGIVNGASSQTYVDGALKASGNPGTGTISGVVLMYDSGSSEHDAADYAELLIYNTALSSTDRGNVEVYLKSKYAIP